MNANPHDETSYIELQHPTPARRRSAPGLPDETAHEIDNYLSSMSPLAVPEEADNGPEGTIQGFIYEEPERRTDSRAASRVYGPSVERDSVDRRGVISVKCTPSSAEIVGTPSDVAVRLSREIERYLPSKRTMLRTEVDEEVSGAAEKLGRGAVRGVPVESGRCPAAFSSRKMLEAGSRGKCSGIVDPLSRRKVPCEHVRTLRDVAYGRRMPRPRGPEKPCGQSRFSREEDTDEYYRQEDEIIHRRGRDGEEQCCERRRVRRPD